VGFDRWLHPVSQRREVKTHDVRKSDDAPQASTHRAPRDVDALRISQDALRLRGSARVRTQSGALVPERQDARVERRGVERRDALADSPDDDPAAVDDLDPAVVDRNRQESCDRGQVSLAPLFL